jgi:hypothetical protein
MSPEERVTDVFDRLKIQLRPKVPQDIRARWTVFTPFTECGDRGPVGGCADEDLVDVFGIKVSVFAETYTECTSESVDEKIKELVFVEFTVCLFVFGHTSTSRPLN